MPGGSSAATDSHPAIPVYAASLPSADALLPYLRLIDASGQYTNRGPLEAKLEGRMAEALALPPVSIALASSGTCALQAAVLVAAGRGRAGRDIAIIPGYTFAATAHAAQACGYEVAFADVDPANWALSPDTVLAHSELHRAGVVIPVAPYGRAFNTAGWAAFANRTGVPVVIDAAACFEAVERDPSCVGPDVPVVLSLHATKAFSTVEGGAVLWRDADKTRRTKEALCFGFTEGAERSVAGPGLNGKLTEYHAAVGLACFDRADDHAARRRVVLETYKAAATRAGIGAHCVATWPVTASNYALFKAPSSAAAGRILKVMGEARIGVRRWYGRGLHRESYFSRIGQPQLPVTEDLADRLLGLPMFQEMSAGQMDTVFTALQSCLHRG